MEMFAEKLRQHKVTIYVRRGGPNYQGGLRKFKEAGEFHSWKGLIWDFINNFLVFFDFFLFFQPPS